MNTSKETSVTIKVAVIAQEPIARRSFSEWSMGFSNPKREELEAIEGINDMDQKKIFLDMRPGRAKKLLQAFSQGRWRLAE